jgi:hypothetical protein
LGSDPDFPVRDFRWYRVPIFWLALALFVASIAGCIVTIMLALGGPDGALPDVGERLLSVPTAHAENTP